MKRRPFATNRRADILAGVYRAEFGRLRIEAAVVSIHTALAAAAVGTSLLAASCGNPSSGTGVPAYASTLYEYVYGVGQHASSIGNAAEEGAKFLGENSAFVKLGGWGGYIVAGFDHDVPNPDEDGGEYDFAVFTQPGVGDEPAVVFVMDDADGDGLPNSTWYELKGGESGADYSSETMDDTDKYIRDYEVTFTRPSDSSGWITWEDNQGDSGTLEAGFPEGDSATYAWWWSGYGEGVGQVIFQGVKLPNSKFATTGVDEDGEETTTWSDYVDRFTWGYAENYSGDDLAEVPFRGFNRTANRFDIADAVDSSGNPADLENIRFIKVQSGVFLVAGRLNEVSTEVSGAVDLHALGDDELSYK